MNKCAECGCPHVGIHTRGHPNLEYTFNRAETFLCCRWCNAKLVVLRADVMAHVVSDARFALDRYGESNEDPVVFALRRIIVNVEGATLPEEVNDG